MPTTYLLPCPNGHPIEIDTGQAGLTVTCTCGAQATAPTLRGFQDLQKSTKQVAAETGTTWRWPHTLMLLGGLVLLPSAVLIGQEISGYPPHPGDLEIDIRRYYAPLDGLTPREVFEGPWQEVQQDLNEAPELPELIVYRRIARDANFRLAVKSGVGGLGLILFVAGAAGAFFTRPRAPKT
jgi:hypothetical protein